MLAEERLFPRSSAAGPACGPLRAPDHRRARPLVANLVDLSAIASVGSAVALMIFLLVGIAGWRRRADTGSNPAIISLAIAVTAIVLAFFAIDTLRERSRDVRRDHRDRRARGRVRRAGRRGGPTPAATDASRWEVSSHADSYGKVHAAGPAQPAGPPSGAEERRGWALQAADAERRRIAADLHDGAQQRLVTLQLGMSLATELIASDPAAAVARLKRLGGEVEAALNELRDLAHGIYPPKLASGGLPRGLGRDCAGAAVTRPAGRSAPAAPISRTGTRPAVYFICREALQERTVKHRRERHRAHGHARRRRRAADLRGRDIRAAALT